MQPRVNRDSLLHDRFVNRKQELHQLELRFNIHNRIMQLKVTAIEYFVDAIGKGKYIKGN